jgi:hypothetical protein
VGELAFQHHLSDALCEMISVHGSRTTNAATCSRLRFALGLLGSTGMVAAGHLREGLVVGVEIEGWGGLRRGARRAGSRAAVRIRAHV